MYSLKYSHHFKKDLRKFKHDSAALESLETVLDIIANGDKLPKDYHNHPLQGEFRHCYECHLKPDILLIYKIEKSELLVLLLRIGSHANLF